MVRTGLVRKRIKDKRGHLKMVWIRPKEEHLGILRRDMPQISHDNVEHFLKWIGKKKVTSSKGTTKVSALKPTQKEINKEKVKSMVKRAKAEGDEFLKKRIIVSSDSYILDGHHRWASLKKFDPNSKIKTVTVDLPIKKLLALANKYPRVEKRSITQFGNSK